MADGQPRDDSGEEEVVCVLIGRSRFARVLCAMLLAGTLAFSGTACTTDDPDADQIEEEAEEQADTLEEQADEAEEDLEEKADEAEEDLRDSTP